jgi:excisionase family DNA binding protein
MENLSLFPISLDELKVLISDTIRIELLRLFEEIKAQTECKDTQDLLTINEASDYLKLAKPTIYGLVWQSKIPCMKRGKKLYFSRQELTNWLKEGKKKTIAELKQEADDFLAKKKKK